MNKHSASGRLFSPFLCSLSLLLVASWAGTAPAESVVVVAVEEDWELVVGTPDPNSDGPQMACTMSPLGDVESLHCMLEINHHTVPAYAPGGLQLEVWQGEKPLHERKFPNQSLLSTPGEVVRWTQKMELNDTGLVFEVINGTSTTWGKFGGQGYLKATVESGLENLNAYDPDVSVANSGISYAANRVHSLVLRRVRLHTSTGEVLEDDTVRPVYPSE